jgi:hypothetical protein
VEFAKSKEFPHAAVRITLPPKQVSAHVERPRE